MKYLNKIRNNQISKGLGKKMKIYDGIDNILDRTEKEPTFFYSGVSLDF